MKNTTIVIADLNTENAMSELTAEEAVLVQGAIWVAVGLAVGAYIIANWPDIKKGLSDGWAQ